MATNQGDRQASVRAVTGTSLTYEGDWHALFDAALIPAGEFNGRLLAWINQTLGASYATVDGAKAAFAAAQGAPSWDGLGAFSLVAPEAETTALLARMSVQPTATRAGQINTLIKALKTAGVWAKLDCFYALAAHDAQAARLNWKGAAFSLSANGTITFATDLGYTGDGTTGYLDTGFAPSTAGGAFVQDSAHLGVWSRTSAQGLNADIGNGNSIIVCRNGSDQLGHRVNAASTAGNAVNTDGAGHCISSRTTSVLTTPYKNGAGLAAASAASVALDASPVRICGRSGTVQYSTRQIAAAHFGAGLSAVEVVALYDALRTYLLAVGAA